jgi:hypothetical protein
MDEKEIKALINCVERILGNPLDADPAELDALFAEFGDGRNPAQTVSDLASKAAQKYRLAGQTVPVHITEALNFTKRALSATGLESTDTLIDALLNPIRGPVQEVSYSFRNRKERTQNDEELLEKLSRELKRDWSKDKEK